MRQATLLFASSLAALAACQQSGAAPAKAKAEARRPASAASAAAPAPGAPAPLDPRDQYDLARAIGAAQDADEPDVMAEVARDWRGRRFQWEVYVVPALCRRAADCHVVPFDHARAGFRIVEGWLPLLALDGDGETALRAACAGHARCVVRFEGELTDFTLSPDLPTALRFDRVHVLGGRAAAAGERWFARQPS